MFTEVVTCTVKKSQFGELHSYEVKCGSLKMCQYEVKSDQQKWSVQVVVRSMLQPWVLSFRQLKLPRT